MDDKWMAEREAYLRARVRPLPGCSTYETEVSCPRAECEGTVDAVITHERQSRDCPGGWDAEWGTCSECKADEWTDVEEDRMWDEYDRGAR